ncbi:tetratricopeptide (TPR) repeat protein [Actinoalloteichus hymeniacidonis]|nr:tetratricopeptide (TPR) repeat protein [Actinoalloteichus hymeniacidonis]
MTVERRSTLTKIANALRVSLSDLTGEQHLLAGSSDEVSGAIPDIRLALLQSSLDDASQECERSILALKSETTRLAVARQSAELATVGRAMPALLVDLHAVAASDGPARAEALRSLVLACQVTTMLVKNLGATDLAWIAAERGHEAAMRLDDPVWIAASEFARSQALIGLGAFARAEALARQAVEMLPNSVDSTELLELRGNTLLTSAFAGAVAETADPAAAITEATELAARTEASNAFFLAFSQANVDQWRISIAMETEDPILAAQVARDLDPERIPFASRRTGLLIDHARALAALRGHDLEVIELLQQAYRLAPTRTQHDIFVREIVTELLLRARRDAGGRDLRFLADRIGLLDPRR